MKRLQMLHILKMIAFRQVHLSGLIS